MTPDQYAIFDQHIKAGHTIVRFWNEWYQRDWDAPAGWYYGVIMEQRPYTLHEQSIGEEAMRGALWDDRFLIEWFEDPGFAERYDGADSPLTDLEIEVSGAWVNLTNLVRADGDAS